MADAIGASARFEQLDMTKEEGWAAELCARHLPLAQFSPGVHFSAHRIVCGYGRIGQSSIFCSGSLRIPSRESHLFGQAR